jgi:hypothetical protein
MTETITTINNKGQSGHNPRQQREARGTKSQTQKAKY